MATSILPQTAEAAGANVSSDFVTDATETAVFRIADILRHPDDLTNKLATVRKRFAVERASIDAQLKTAVESQLDDAQRGLDTLAVTKGETLRIRSNLSAVDERCTAAQNTIKNYARIKKISRTHQNFVATKAMVEQFQRLNDEVARIRLLLVEDAEDLLGPAPNLLLIHFKLQQLEEFRNTTLAKARRSPPDVLNTLHDYFHKVDLLEQDFEAHLFQLATYTVDLIKGGNASTVVRIVKVIETEERADEVASVQEVVSPTGGSGAELISDFDSSRPRPIKSYRIKYFDALRDAIVDEIKRMYEKNKDDLPQVLAQFDTVVDNLILVHDELVPRFPKRYNIFHFYVLEYHRAIYDTVHQITAGPIEPGFILQLLGWVREYYLSMSSRLDVSEELLEPRLLDGREEQLTGEYVKLVRCKLAEWLSNILHTETVDFLQRRHEPETDGSGNYLLAGSVIVFQMFNQQVDLVSSSSRGELLYDVVKECCRTLDEFHKAWTKIMDSEYHKFVDKDNQHHNKHGTELAEGLPDYIVALANDCLRSSEFSEQLLQRTEALMDAAFRPQLAQLIKEATDGFMKVSRRATQILVDIVVADLKPAWNFLHCQPQWYDQDIMRLIVGTLEDYCEDFKVTMAEYLFNRFMTDLMDRMVASYIESLHNKTVKFKMPGAPDKMRQDLASLTEFWGNYKTPKRVKAAFEVIEKLIAFVESNPRMAFLDFYSLWKVYPDCPLEFFEWLLTRRDDLDKATVKEVMEACRNKAQEERPEQIQPTIFSRLKLK
ncbi:exocyst complex component Sec6-domain-containing protein [Powellomyces hirtus]|nr:exocyst complex component Sec6-domain-containing protein [Powellomyces hirtus]